MKQALKNYKVYIATAILTVIGVGLPLLIVGITIWSGNGNVFNGYIYLMGLLAVVFFFIGFIWGDVISGRWRKKQKDWDGPLPPEIKTTIWVRRWPLYFSAIITILVFVAFDIVYAVAGHFPFLG